MDLFYGYVARFYFGFANFVNRFFGGICFYFLEKSIKSLGAGITYCVFTGMGTIGTAFIGVLILNQSMNFLQILAVFIILVSVIGLKFSTSKKEV